MPPRPPLLSSSDCVMSLAFGAVPWILPPIVAEVPSPSTEPATCVPWPSGSSEVARPSATSLRTRPVKAACVLVVEPLSKPVSLTTTIWPAPWYDVPLISTSALRIGRATLL